ncbi:peroxiredoxin-like family protein [Ramlibacter sp.]|uniref:peroxiredoxin-like family protein n=1 Tax=Ramlibacter sp. TaxID=1917967 RepID=UPI0017A30737|nr:peroxiredoxin-like family protein [Ramlibacter sp.]MBA2675451.1 AhpC/TSA family protein [Ramlibacter sp.]
MSIDTPNTQARPATLDSLPSLAEKTSAFFQQYLRKEKPEVIALKAQVQAELTASGIGKTCLQAGAKMPMFVLPNANGETVAAEALLARGPLVISFYRGAWCGFCNLEMRALQDAVPFIREAGGELVAISPDVSDGPSELAETFGVDFDLLLDRGNAVARAFGLTYAMDERLRPLYKDGFGIDIGSYNEDPSWELPLTATYIVDGSGTIVEAFTDPDHTQRMEPRDIVLRLRSLRGAQAGR